MNSSVSCERCGRFPPVVKTAVPVDGRFEHIVLSCNATSDHAIIWIEKEAKWALEVSFIIQPNFYADCLKFNEILEYEHSFAFHYITFSSAVHVSLSIIVHEVEVAIGESNVKLSPHIPLYNCPRSQSCH